MISEATQRSQRISIALLIATLAFIALGYWNALANGFVYDDNWQILRNPLVQQPSLYKTALTSDVWAFRTGDFSAASNYYRPVFTAWTIINYALFGESPLGWHVANLLLHIISVFLLWRVLSKLNAHRAVAAAVTWVFAAHPAHVESVTWIAGATDLLMAVFGLYAFLKWLEVRESPSATGWLLALGSFFLAMGAKEVALGWVPIIFITDLALRSHTGDRRKWVRAFRSAAPFLATGVVFVCLRLSLIGRGLAAQQQIGWGSMVLTTPELWAFYVKQTFFPFDLSTAYPLRSVTRENLNMQNFWLPTVLGLGTATVLIVMARKKALWAMSAALAFFLLIPAFYVKAFHPEHIARDRYLYLPLAGAFLLLFDGLASRWPRLIEGDERSKLSLFGGTVALLLAVLTMMYNPAWRDDASFWTRGVSSDPQSVTANMNLAEALRQEKAFDQAITYGNRATDLAPDLARPWTILGMAYRDAGDFRQAEIALRRAMEVKEDVQIAGENLGELLSGQGRTDEALDVYREMILVMPSSKLVNEQSMAIVLVTAGRREEALAVLEQSRPDLEQNRVPQVQRSWYFLGDLYRTMGRAKEAEAAYRRFLERTSSRDPSVSRMRDQAAGFLNN